MRRQEIMRFKFSNLTALFVNEMLLKQNDMKKLLVVLLTIVSLILTGCSDSKKLIVDGKEVNVEPYGLFNQDTKRVDGVVYKISPTNVIVGLIFSETVVVPVYIVGWDLLEPDRAENKPTTQTTEKSTETK